MATHSEPERAGLVDRVHGNIRSIEELKVESERALSNRQLRIERVARRIGRPGTVIALLCGSAAWIGINAYLIAIGRTPLDPPPFFWLQGTLGLFAALVTTMVLVAQSRQQRDAERRAHLELHVNLLAEQKATKIISLLEELRRDLPQVRDRIDPVAEALQEEVDPRTVHDALQTGRTRRKSPL
jgi:uncharacterized membrane protein